MTDKMMVWQQQEIPFDDPASNYRFNIFGTKPMVVTRNAAAEFTREEILDVLKQLATKAVQQDGLDYLQTFRDKLDRRLWVIENDEAITVLLPEDY